MCLLRGPHPQPYPSNSYHSELDSNSGSGQRCDLPDKITYWDIHLSPASKSLRLPLPTVKIRSFNIVVHVVYYTKTPVKRLSVC